MSLFSPRTWPIKFKRLLKISLTVNSTPILVVGTMWCAIVFVVSSRLSWLSHKNWYMVFFANNSAEWVLTINEKPVLKKKFSLWMRDAIPWKGIFQIKNILVETLAIKRLIITTNMTIETRLFHYYFNYSLLEYASLSRQSKVK